MHPESDPPGAPGRAPGCCPGRARDQAVPRAGPRAAARPPRPRGRAGAAGAQSPRCGRQWASQPAAPTAPGNTRLANDGGARRAGHAGLGGGTGGLARGAHGLERGAGRDALGRGSRPGRADAVGAEDSHCAGSWDAPGAATGGEWGRWCGAAQVTAGAGAAPPPCPPARRAPRAVPRATAPRRRMDPLPRPAGADRALRRARGRGGRPPAAGGAGGAPTARGPATSPGEVSLWAAPMGGRARARTPVPDPGARRQLQVQADAAQTPPGPGTTLAAPMQQGRPLHQGPHPGSGSQAARSRTGITPIPHRTGGRGGSHAAGEVEQHDWRGGGAGRGGRQRGSSTCMLGRRPALPGGARALLCVSPRPPRPPITVAMVPTVPSAMPLAWGAAAEGGKCGSVRWCCGAAAHRGPGAPRLPSATLPAARCGRPLEGGQAPGAAGGNLVLQRRPAAPCPSASLPTPFLLAPSPSPSSAPHLAAGGVVLDEAALGGVALLAAVVAGQLLEGGGLRVFWGEAGRVSAGLGPYRFGATRLLCRPQPLGCAPSADPAPAAPRGQPPWRTSQ
jgi:hypothetical protein